MRRANYPDTTPVEIIVDWLRATRKLSDCQEGASAKADWVRVFSRDETERAGLLQASTSVRKETLRHGSVRLDCVCMLIWRRLFSQVNLDNLCLYVYCDASPQRRGQELFATSMDVVDRDSEFTRRLLLPIICLGRSCLGVTGLINPLGTKA